MAKRINLLCLLFFFAFGFIHSQTPVKKVLMEEFTGAWCNVCPDGEVYMAWVKDSFPNIIPVSIHNADAMSNSDGNSIGAYFTSSVPSATFDRMTAATNPGGWFTGAYNADQIPPTASVEIMNVSYDAQTRELILAVKIDFVAADSGDLRISCYVVEDSVVGSGTGYDQANLFNTSSGHPFYQAGDPIVGFVHRHVMRDALGSAWGSAGSTIPNTVSAGESYTTYFYTTLDTAWDVGQISLVGFLNRYDGTAPGDRHVINATDFKLDELTSDEIPYDIYSGVRIYPVPFSHTLKVSYSNYSPLTHIQMYDLHGKLVAEDELPGDRSGEWEWTGMDGGALPLEAGVYILRIDTEEGEPIIRKVLKR